MDVRLNGMFGELMPEIRVDVDLHRDLDKDDRMRIISVLLFPSSTVGVELSEEAAELRKEVFETLKRLGYG